MKEKMFFYVVFIGLLFAGLIGVQACVPAKNVLEGTEWQLITIGKIRMIEGTQISLQFDSEEVSGTASCNSYFARYETSGGTLSMDGIGSTEMWCMEPEGIMDQESWYLNSLSNIDSFSVAKDQLTIVLNDGERLIFEATQ
ncbi:MAG: META domain-containing protein [Anaerolineaceae bacterium]|nr:META domain-containing protein [Anaerolineaceae bacterium]